MYTYAHQKLLKNSSNKQTKKWSKFICDSLKYLLGTGFMVTLIGWIGNYLAEQAQKQMIMTDYIKEISRLILSEELYRKEVSVDDLNNQILNQLLEKKSVLDRNYLSNIITLEKENANKKHEEKQLIARALTLSTLRRFGNDRNLKGQVIQFLYESDLIGFCKPQYRINDPSELKCSEPIIRLGYANIDNANVQKVIPLLNGLSLQNANLKGANFSGISLLFTKFESAVLNNADFSISDLYKANFESAFLKNTNFESAFLKNTNFKSATLNNANFKSATLNNADFSNKADVLSGAILNKANFENACLLGTNFSKALGINEANFKGAFYDQKTIFPPEFKGRDSMRKWTSAMTDCT